MKPKKIYIIIEGSEKKPVSNLKKVFEYAFTLGTEVIAECGEKKVLIKNYVGFHRHFKTGIIIHSNGNQFTVEESKLY